MIRPCDDCGGRGDFFGAAYSMPGETEVHETRRPCGRCKDMPKLPHLVMTATTLQEIYQADGDGYMAMSHRGWFKPDPDTVIRWCVDHESHLIRDYCVWVERLPGRTRKPPCVIRWIATPEPLTEWNDT